MFESTICYRVRYDAPGCTRMLTTTDGQPLLVDSPDVDQIPADVAIETDGTPRFEMAIRHQVRCGGPGCTRILVDDYGDYGQPPGDRNHRLAANAANAAAEQGWRWDITGRPGWWCPDCITWLYGDDYCENEDCAPYYCPRKTSEI